MINLYHKDCMEFMKGELEILKTLVIDVIKELDELLKLKKGLLTWKMI